MNEICRKANTGHSSENLLQINGLSKRFNSVVVLDNVSFEVKRGSIVGVLGLNGAGKTTFFKCILGLLSPDTGTILFNGTPIEPETVRQKIGYLPEFSLPPGELTAGLYLRLLNIALKNPLSDVNTLLEQTQLDPKKPISDYSRGMIQRLGLAIAVLKSPELLILDEPTLGLDPLARRNLLKMLTKLNEKGTTILFSSHDFIQVENICQYIAILHDRTFRFVGTAETLKNRYKTESLEQAFFCEIGVTENA